MSSITYNEIHIFSDNETIQKQLPIIIQAPKFINYISTLDKNILNIRDLRINNVKWFCNPSNPDPKKLGFLYMELNATDIRTGQPVPGIVFLRGNAVAVYIIVQVEDKKYVILTRQMRIPLGRLVDEIPAGMMDAENNFSGVAIKEISEETGLTTPSITDLILLGNPIIPSAGGCDEQIQLFLWKTTISLEKFKEIQEKIHGAANENESIKLIFIPFEEYEEKLLTLGDVKAICAHQFAKQTGLLNEV